MTDLTKWPLLLVTGDPVTEQQANEILVRTDQWMLMTNDRQWLVQVCDLVGMKHDRWHPDWSSQETLKSELGVLSLEYLRNERIVSSWIGGPHGWCDWDGTIGTSNYNVGKWPDQDHLTDEWAAIAAAFPFLELRAQVVPDEGEAGAAAVEWRVHNGNVEVVSDPGALIRRPTDADVTNLLRVGGERGVSLARLDTAVRQVRDSHVEVSGPRAELPDRHEGTP